MWTSLGVGAMRDRAASFARHIKRKTVPLARPLSVAAFLVSSLMTVYWFTHVPAPGKAIGLLGAVAVFIALRGEMREIHGSEKAIWLLIVFTLFYIEIRAINKDRDQHDLEQIAARKEERNSFQRIADQITGGDSFCYMQIMADGSPVFIHEGKYPLYDVEARVTDVVRFRKLVQQGQIPGLRADLMLRPGNLSVGKAWIDFGTRIQFSDPSRQDFNVFFGARNGSWTEILRMRKTNGTWEHAMKVTVNVASWDDARITGRKVREEISSGFPKEDLAGDSDWTGDTR